jgi:hypothetical protein
MGEYFRDCWETGHPLLVKKNLDAKKKSIYKQTDICGTEKRQRRKNPPEMNKAFQSFHVDKAPGRWADSQQRSASHSQDRGSGIWDMFAFCFCSSPCHRWPFIDWPKCPRPVALTGTERTTRCGTTGLLMNCCIPNFPGNFYWSLGGSDAETST